jgi:hypothetical protein
MRKYVWIVAGLLTTACIVSGQELSEFRRLFDSKQFNQLLDPLIDYRLNLGTASGPNIDEVDYMVATTFCSLGHDKDGCEYATKLKPVLFFRSRAFKTRDHFAACCVRAGMSRPCYAGADGKADTASDPGCASSDGKFDSSRGPSGRSIAAILRQAHRRGGTDSDAKLCASLVQGRIAWDYQGSRGWDPQNLQNLCRGTSNPSQPPQCFERVMHGGINWGGGTQWQWQNALELCAGTNNAPASIQCFQDRITQGAQWPDAIRACKQ